MSTLDFRLWSLDHEKMYQVNKIDFDNNYFIATYTSESGRRYRYSFNKNYALMKATDLRDENDHLIFEGDIVHDKTTGDEWTVMWCEECGAWTDGEDHGKHEHGLYKSLEKSLTVIGNVFVKEAK